MATPRPQTAPADPAAASRAAAGSSIVVGVRVRPLTVTEQASGARSLIRVVDEQVLCFDPACNDDMHIASKLRGVRMIGHRAAKDQKYAFDCVFDTDATQEQVYQKTARPQIESVLSGYNATVFAYGATGAGKTHTMIGDRVTGPGVMVLAMEDLFAAIHSRELDSRYQLSLSYLEVYNETIRDLLAPALGAAGVAAGAEGAGAEGGEKAAAPGAAHAPPTGGLCLREDARNGIHVAGLTQHVPRSSDEVLELLQRGNTNRAMSSTNANAVSSRSHAVLQICVRETAKTADVHADIRLGKLSLIDLAGSERASVTANRGKQLHEGANINKSLLALSNCINALGRGDTRHIPYRDSKLTRLLKDSLGGNCKTTMIAAVSAARSHYEDTLNTLKYANRAKEIKLKASRNTIKVDYHIAKYAEIIGQLRDEVALWRGKYSAAVEAAALGGAGRLPAAPPPPAGGAGAGAEAERAAAASAGAEPASGPARTAADAPGSPASVARDRERGQAAYMRIEKHFNVAATALRQLGELRVRERAAAAELEEARAADAAARRALDEAKAKAGAEGAPADALGAAQRAEAHAEEAADRLSAAEEGSTQYARVRRGLHTTLSAAYSAFDSLDRALSRPAEGADGGEDAFYICSDERRALLQQEIRCRVLQLQNLDLGAKLAAQQQQHAQPQPQPRAGQEAAGASGAEPKPQSSGAEAGAERVVGTAVVIAQLWALVKAQSHILDAHGLSTHELVQQYAHAAQSCGSKTAGAAGADKAAEPGARARGAGARGGLKPPTDGGSGSNVIPSPAVRRSIGRLFSPAQHAPAPAASSGGAGPARAAPAAVADGGAGAPVNSGAASGGGDGARAERAAAPPAGAPPVGAPPPGAPPLAPTAGAAAPSAQEGGAQLKTRRLPVNVPPLALAAAQRSAAAASASASAGSGAATQRAASAGTSSAGAASTHPTGAHTHRDAPRAGAENGPAGAPSVFSRLFAKSARGRARAGAGGGMPVLHESNGGGGGGSGGSTLSRAARVADGFSASAVGKLGGGAMRRPTTAEGGGRPRAARATMPAGARRPQTAAVKSAQAVGAGAPEPKREPLRANWA